MCIRDRDGKVNYKEDFFGKETNLTVSGQLNAETFALAFRNVYTFGPTFRAENSNTARHAAEFWMVEPEIALSLIHIYFQYPDQKALKIHHPNKLPLVAQLIHSYNFFD